MAKTFALIFFAVLLSFSAKSNTEQLVDSAYVSRLSPEESRMIRNLVKGDSSLLNTQTNLQLELYKYDANLLYKYRLDSISSAIPLDYNAYVQSYIDLFSQKRQQQIGQMLSLGNYYFPIFEKALKASHVPEEFKYLPIVESSLNPQAVSRVGATGLWQFMYTTARGYGLSIDHYVDERKDPIQSSFAAAAYLKDAYARLGDWLLALAAYNCGAGAVSRAVERAGGPGVTFWDIQKFLPSETRNYVPKFIAVTYMMRYYDRHPGIEIPYSDLHLKIDSIYVNKHVPFDKLSSVLRIEQDELAILNPEYKKHVVNGSPERPKRVIIPKVDYSTYAALFDVLNDDSQSNLIMASVIDRAPGAETKPVNHTVRRGDNLTDIAQKYRVEVQDLKVWNKLKSFKIFPGQKLYVVNPKTIKSLQSTNQARQYFSYQVKSGDTLKSIARQFKGASPEAIAKLNNLKNESLKSGMVLKVGVM